MEKRSSVIGGVILIVVGALFLVLQMFPSVAERLNWADQWPLIIVGIGGLFLVSALFGTPELAVPGSFLAGLGGLLYYQSITDNWGSWAYAWTLLPGFAGVGLILQGLLRGQMRRGLAEGGQLLLFSLVMFAIFGSFLGDWGFGGFLWPLALILIGLWLLFKNLMQRGSEKAE